jgi:hypothetical protein
MAAKEMGGRIQVKKKKLSSANSGHTTELLRLVY